MGVLVQPTPPAPASLCRYIDTWRGTNIPISPAVEATDIAHAIAVSIDGTPVGWIVYRRDGRAWYFDGPISWRRATPAQSRVVLDSLGLAHDANGDVGRGAMIPLDHDASLQRLTSNGIAVDSCY